VLAADEAGHKIVGHIGDEGARKHRLGVAVRAVVEHGPGGFDR
jgi:hypothetical protein